MTARAWYLLPARVWTALFLAAPLAIICAYSFLTRGDYGGVEKPWTLESLGPALLDASADLGARPFATLWRVIIPVSAPGIAAGAVLVFIPCLGAYLTPDLLGGGKSVMLGNLVQNQFTTARDWPFGSAISLALMAVVMLLLIAFVRRDEEGLL